MVARPALAGAALLAVIAVATVVTTAASPRTSTRPSPVNPNGASEASTIAPLLADAAAEARALVALGERRSRNLFEIRSAQGRMEDKLAAVEATVGRRPASDLLAPALAAYRSGAAAVREAIAEAQAGFLRLDWDRVAEANRTMGDGADRLQRAADLLAPPPAATPTAADLPREAGGFARRSPTGRDLAPPVL